MKYRDLYTLSLQSEKRKKIEIRPKNGSESYEKNQKWVKTLDKGMKSAILNKSATAQKQLEKKTEKDDRMKNSGIDRVLEPKGSLAVTAWKVDNDKTLRAKELRIAVDMISMERDSLLQICSISEYDEDKIKEKIFKIVRERGKLQNPYTESGGLFSGIVEEISEDLTDCGLKPGDRVVSLTTMTALPFYLESIRSIDYEYGLLHCTGYAICFEATVLREINQFDGGQIKTLLRALDEEGSFYGISSQLAEMQADNGVIIGNSLVEIILYARMLKQCNPDMTISCLFESSRGGSVQAEQHALLEAIGSLVSELWFLPMNLPVETARSVQEAQKGRNVDVVINLEEIKGCESVAALIVRPGGLVCHTNIGNAYSKGMLIADSLGKEVINYALDGIYANTFDYALQLVRETEKVFRNLDEFYSKTHINSIKKRKASMIKEERTQMAAKQIDGFLYMSSVTEDMVEEVLNVAQYDCNVIIQGETGVGKEKVFDLIQQNSPRRSQPCVKINCATIQENLAESEFFGYEKGSFTGASTSGKEGYFEIANNGTLFLDEIGSLPLVMQSKLLRVLQENSFYRVGGTTPKNVNVRVICANNIPLRKLVDEGKFREDLYYRLNICSIDVPPLRQRPEDIDCLAGAFIRHYSQRYGIQKTFTAEAFQKLEEYHWPGNVRELENTVHRLYISERSQKIDADAVDELLNVNVYDESMIDLKKEFRREESIDFTKIMEEQEKKLIAYALKKEGTTRKAAEFLNIPQTTLARKKIKHQL